MTKASSQLCMGCMSPTAGQAVCPRCGYDSNSGYDKTYISPGTLLADRYLAGRLVHKNGEGAQYIGYDNKNRQTVWIQEYFPHTIAERGAETSNILALPGHGAQYKALMSDFVDTCNEVKRLSITEPVVPIEDVINENNTVYAIYKDLKLIPLETWLEKAGGRLSYTHALELFMPLFNTLSNIHGHGAIHRGISPYTIYIDTDEKLYLWDFALSPVRTANSELEAELFNGYSAPEQYSSSGWQGAWTDVYAVAALFYRAVSGVVPPKSTLIGPGRPIPPLLDHVIDLPHNISEAIGQAMAPRTEDRTQSIATLASQLMQSGGGMAQTAIYDTYKHKPVPSPKKAARQDLPPEEKNKGGSGKYIMFGLLLTVLVLVGLIGIFMAKFYPNLVGSTPGGRDTSQSDENASTPGDPNDPDAVPRFVGMDADEVVKLGETTYSDRFEFRLSEDYDEVYEKGVVFDQSPPEGTSMPEKGTIILFVSKGPYVVEMPDLVGEAVDDAIEALFKLDPDLKVEIVEQYSSTADPGAIIRTTPTADAEVDPKRTTVYLFVNPEVTVESGNPRPKPESSKQEESSRSSQDENGALYDDEGVLIFRP